MKKIIFGLILIVFLGYLFFASDNSQNTSNYNSKEYFNSSSVTSDYENYDIGYEWAEYNGTEDFSDCDYQFGSGTEAEDGCNSYVQENQYYEYPTFGGYDCTEDCSGHEAGYEWAENNGIYDLDDCGGNSNSFIEGCMSYVEENY